MRSSLKRSGMKSLLCLALSVIILAGFIPLNAKADAIYKYNIVTLKQNTTVSVKDSDTYDFDTGVQNYTLYKISVPADGYIKFQLSNADAGIALYKSFYTNRNLSDANIIRCLYDKKTHFFVLPKGTYYLHLYKDEAYTTLKWTFTKLSKKANYCRARASALARTKKANCMFHYGYEHAKWYKIKLTKKQKITITLKTLDDQFSLGMVRVFNSKEKLINTKMQESGDNAYALSVYQSDTLPKGIYYIRLSRKYDYNNSDYAVGRLAQLSWK